MKLDISLLHKKTLSLIRSIGRAADDAGLCVYLVGGMVRDILLKRPSVDVDVLVEGDGLAFARELALRLDASMLSHPRFLTATLTLKSGEAIDIVTARRETYSKPGALPVVSAATISEDLFRRDFTINALAVSINSRTFGELRDDHNGLKDLKAGLISVMHEKSFQDDPTRILRAVRYEQRFGFRIAPATLRVLKAAINDGCFSTISPVRYFNDLRRILEEPVPYRGMARLSGLGALRVFSYDQRAAATLKEAVKLVERAARWPIIFDPGVLYFIVLAERVDRNRIGQVLMDISLTRDIKRKILEALQFLTVLDMLVRDPQAVKLDKFEIEASLFFMLKAPSWKLKEMIKKGVVL